MSFTLSGNGIWSQVKTCQFPNSNMSQMLWTESRQIKAKDSPQIKDGTMEIAQETLIAEPSWVK